MKKEPKLDELDEKLSKSFPGRIVRKDLVKNLKLGFTIPVFVLEYLLGKYCSTTDETEIQSGLVHVKTAISERIVRGDESELVKARLERLGSVKLIDLVTVTFDEKGGKYWAHLATCGLSHVNIDPKFVYRNERLLTGGVWSNVELIYDESMVYHGVLRPFVISRLSPIQVASADLEEYLRGREQFTRDEWINVLLRSLGYEPTHRDFTFRRKLLLLLRLVPMVEKNYNLIELGPRGTGKSYIYREISPYVMLLSGGQGTIPDLFGWKGRRDKPGLILKNDVVAFDEVAGPSFKDESSKQMFKGYMEQGSFSRGDDKGSLSADSGIVFIGNLDSDVETTMRLSHLFSILPETIRSDMAFHDRWHAYLPGWELLYVKPSHFTSHMGFVADYLAEIFHSELRRFNYTDIYRKYFTLGSQVEERDRRAVIRTVSGLIKLIHPDENASKEEIEEYLSFAIEHRRRVKEQLRRMGGLEYSKVDLSYIDKESGKETIVYCREPTLTEIIPDAPPIPGDIFTVGFDREEGRYALFRIQTSVIPGKKGLSLIGINSREIKESARIAYDLVRMTARDLGLDQNVYEYTVKVQVTSPMQGRSSEDLGVAFFLSLASAFLNRSATSKLVVLGHMNLHGELRPVQGLESKLHIAQDAGARIVLIPTKNQQDLDKLSSELVNSLNFKYYNKLAQSVVQGLQLTNAEPK
jgi:ATP-dependent Lon protease